MDVAGTWVEFAVRLALTAPLLFCSLYLAIAPEKVLRGFEEANLRLGGSPWFGTPRRFAHLPAGGFVRWIGVLFTVYWLVRVTGLDRLAGR
jgi:hypothetical protein